MAFLNKRKVTAHDRKELYRGLYQSERNEAFRELKKVRKSKK